MKILKKHKQVYFLMFNKLFSSVKKKYVPDNDKKFSAFFFTIIICSDIILSWKNIHTFDKNIKLVILLNHDPIF